LQSKRGTLLLGLVLIFILVTALSGCTTATIKVTLKDEDGAALKDITLTVGEQVAKSDASGVVTVKGLKAGQVTLKFTGSNYSEDRTETVKVGSNEFSYQLQSHAWQARPFNDLAKWRIRVTTFGMEEPVTGEFVRGQGVHWTLPDGSEIISLFDVVYYRGAGSSWKRLAWSGSAQSTGDMMAQLTNTFLGEFQAFDTRVSDSLMETTWVGTEQVNGYDCKVFTVSWSAGTGGSGSYKVYVVAKGEFKGYVTRYQWDVESLGTSVIDAYDFGAQLEVKAPI